MLHTTLPTNKQGLATADPLLLHELHFSSTHSLSHSIPPLTRALSFNIQARQSASACISPRSPRHQSPVDGLTIKLHAPCAPNRQALTEECGARNRVGLE
jgi:hypothetical protein